MFIFFFFSPRLSSLLVLSLLFNKHRMHECVHCFYSLYFLAAFASVQCDMCIEPQYHWCTFVRLVFAPTASQPMNIDLKRLNEKNKKLEPMCTLFDQKDSDEMNGVAMRNAPPKVRTRTCMAGGIQSVISERRIAFGKWMVPMCPSTLMIIRASRIFIT